MTKTSFTEVWNIAADSCMKARGSKEIRAAKSPARDRPAIAGDSPVAADFRRRYHLLNSKIFQLTYKTEIGYVYDFATFKQQSTFKYQGRRLVTDQRRIADLHDDGSSQIRVWDPATLQEKKRIKVHDGARAIVELNENGMGARRDLREHLEDGSHARIAPADGHVTG